MLYNQWMPEEIHEITPSNRIKKSSYLQLAEWVKMRGNLLIQI